MANRAGVSRSGQKREVMVGLDLTPGEIDQLLALAHFYEKNMGRMRHIIRLTASREVRSKLHFIQEESLWLERLAADLSDEAPERESRVHLKLRAFVAFWGRVLASLNTRRSRRKLKGDTLVEREELAAKFGVAARRLQLTDGAALEREMQTRRPREVGWMRDVLQGDGAS